MDIELNVLERLALLSILPEQGNLTALRIIRKLREDLSFSEEENAALNFQIAEGQVRWNTDADTVKAITFGATALEFVLDQLRAKSEAGELRQDHLSLCDKLGLDE